MHVIATKGFILIDALMAVLLLALAIVVVLNYQAKQTTVGFLLIRQIDLQQRVQRYHEERIIARHAISYPEDWRVRESSVIVSVKKCGFPVREVKNFCWQQLYVPWPEVNGIRERYVVSGYAQE